MRELYRFLEGARLDSSEDLPADNELPEPPAACSNEEIGGGVVQGDDGDATHCSYTSRQRSGIWWWTCYFHEQ